jgi:VWFA-related protein
VKHLLNRVLAPAIQQRTTQPAIPYWNSELEEQAQKQLTLVRHYMISEKWDQALESLVELYTTAARFSQFDQVLLALGQVLTKLNEPELAEKITQQLKNHSSQPTTAPVDSPEPMSSKVEKSKPIFKDQRQQRLDQQAPDLKADEPKPASAKHAQPNASGQAPTISLFSELVNIPVIARDSQGRYVGDLKQEEFSIYEDKVRQEIAFFATTEEPLTVALLLDTSLSTTDELPRIQGAAIEFIEQLRPQDQVLVVSFNQDIQVQNQLTADREKLRAAVRATRSGSTTRLYDALMLAVVEPLSQIQGRRAIVLLTDGYDSASKIIERDEVIKIVEEAGVLIYMIAYDTRKAMEQLVRQQPEKDDISAKLLGMQRGYHLARKFLRQLEEVSGGRLYSANKLEDLPGTFATIAQELRHLYSLGYYPSNDSADSRFRKIQVKVNRKGVNVHARAGYYPHQP